MPGSARRDPPAQAAYRSRCVHAVRSSINADDRDRTCRAAPQIVHGVPQGFVRSTSCANRSLARAPARGSARDRSPEFHRSLPAVSVTHGRRIPSGVRTRSVVARLRGVQAICGLWPNWSPIGRSTCSWGTPMGRLTPEDDESDRHRGHTPISRCETARITGAGW